MLVAERWSLHAGKRHRVLGKTWHTTSMVPKCDRCAAVMAAQDEGQ